MRRGWEPGFLGPLGLEWGAASCKVAFPSGSLGISARRQRDRSAGFSGRGGVPGTMSQTSGFLKERLGHINWEPRAELKLNSGDEVSLSHDDSQ